MGKQNVGTSHPSHCDKIEHLRIFNIVVRELARSIDIIRHRLSFIVAFRATVSRMTNFDIKIVSDTVCPWCYVGKKRLEKGIAAYKQKYPDSNDTFSTTWYPFYLMPDAPKNVDKTKYYESK